ncbi:MAG TPA: glycosyltransferase [Nocardioidaceae bacterium]|nr:glycosyltransferase [Nocardioidaceae bacterium]
MTAADLVSAARRRLALGTRLRAADARLLATRYARWRTSPVRPRTVLYEAFSGNGVLDNPEAIFRYLLTQSDLADLRHTWVLNDLDAHPEVVAEFADDPRVDFVAIRSPGYFKALATSAYLVNNATFPQEFAKRPEQVYLNTWHGVPLKHMGFDMPEGGPLSRNIVRNFLNADYLLSANDYMTRTIYRHAYRLQGIFRGAVIEEGQPRTDRQAQAVHDREGTLRLLAERGVRVDGRRVVLYAPTWRGDRFSDPHINAAQLLTTVRELQKGLGPDHVVLLKVHQVVYEMAQRRFGEHPFLVPNSIPTNLVLAAADALVTDYSSIFFDYAITGRPVVHYVPDLSDYRSGRGLYLDEAQLPGPLCETVEQTLQAVRLGLAEGSPERVRSLAEAFTPHDDGSVCERVVDLVFRGRDEADYRVHRDFGTDKEKLLVYLGSMKSQGITTSALNLLRNLDFDRYDVTAFYPWSRGRDRAKNISLVDDRVRVIPRAPLFIGSPRRVAEETRNLMVNGLPDRLTDQHRRFWAEEWQRMFGHARFDHLIDFSGYGCYTPFLYSVAEAEHKSIWLHNDMDADMQRETIGEKHLEDRLRAVFSTYRYFDHLVSVSPALDRVNREKLSAYARPAQFTYAANTIDGDRVLRMAGFSGGLSPDEARGSGDVRRAVSAAPPERAASFDTDNLAAAVTSLLQHYSPSDVLRETRSRLQLERARIETGSTIFVSVGRLSPEKNHARLIKAFAKVHEDHPATRLVILGGGRLEQELDELVLSMGLESVVTLAGQVDNPYAIMAEAHCFVLSSDYEGQPMVILEARLLGLPVVTTAFSSVGDSVPPGAGLVVPQTVKGVAQGMRRFLAGEVPSATLDAAAYNRSAMQQFDRAVHGLSPEVEQVVDGASR